MNVDEKIAKVLEVAMMTEDLEPAERRAIVDVAHRTDARLNRGTTTNPRFDQRTGRLESVSRLAIDAGCDKATCRPCQKTRRLLANGGLHD